MNGDSAVTVTCSVNEPTFIARSRLTVWFCVTTTFSRFRVWNPWSVILIV